MTSGVASRLMRLSPRSSAARLLFVPHAGGLAQHYRQWADDAGEGLEVWATELPGRLNDAGEPRVADIDKAVAAVAADTAALLDRPLAVFGHSMGALLAFEAVRMLERRGESPAGLFVSGCPAPRARGARTRRPKDDAHLIALLRGWGGTPAKLLDDREFLALALPPLRADLELVERYVPQAGAVSVPLTAFAGSQDETAPVEEVREWSGYSTRWRGLRVLPGGHFFIDDARGAILDVVATAFAAG